MRLLIGILLNLTIVNANPATDVGVGKASRNSLTTEDCLIVPKLVKTERKLGSCRALYEETYEKLEKTHVNQFAYFNTTCRQSFSLKVSRLVGIPNKVSFYCTQSFYLVPDEEQYKVTWK